MFLKQMAYDAKYLRLPEIRWLGAFPSDSENYQLPQQCLLNLTAKGVGKRTSFLYYEILICLTIVWNYLPDKQKAEGILHRCYMEREAPRWRFNSGLCSLFLKKRKIIEKLMCSTNPT